MSDKTSDPLANARSTDGGLYDLGWYLGWNTWEAKATLDGQFTAEELRAIADHMDKNFREREPNREA